MSAPTKCNKCNSTNIKHQVWGRTEYYVCTDCLTEVTEPVPTSNIKHRRLGNSLDYIITLPSTSCFPNDDAEKSYYDKAWEQYQQGWLTEERSKLLKKDKK